MASTESNMSKYGVAWFKFDESTSTQLIDSKGSNVGTVAGTTVITGVNGNARSFNGTSDFIKFTGTLIPIGAKSIHFKIRVPSIPSTTGYTLINVNNFSTQQGFGIQVDADGKMTFVGSQASSTFRYLLTTPNNICDNQWHDILFTWDGTINTGAVKLYVDHLEKPVATATAASQETTAYHTGGTAIGRIGSTGTTGYLKFDIDELEIYNVVIIPPVSKFLISSEDKYYSITSTYRDNAIPAMTSNTSPSGVAEASSMYSTFYPWKAFDRIVDQNGWVSASGVLVGWLSYEFPSAITITGYSIKSGKTPANRLPKNWTFEGWDGAKWIVLDLRVNEPNFGTEDLRFYGFINKIAYKKYRINVTANQGAGDFLSIGDFGMYESYTYVSYVQNTESDFIINGMNKGMVIGLNDEFSEKRLLVKINSSLGSGKVFKQKIDTTKIPIKKASIT